MKIYHFCLGMKREHYEASRDRVTKEKRSLPMHESRNVDTSEKNAPSKKNQNRKFILSLNENYIITRIGKCEIL